MKYNRKSARLFALLKGLQTEFFGVFVMIFSWAVIRAMGVLGNIMFGFTGVMCVVCIMADFGLKQGNAAASADNLHGDTVGRRFGIQLGLIAMAPFAVTALVLAVSKFGGKFDFLGAYKVLNACIYPIIQLFAPSADIAGFSPALFLLIAGYLALFPFSAYIGFKWGYNKVDLKDVFVYRKK